MIIQVKNNSERRPSLLTMFHLFDGKSLEKSEPEKVTHVCDIVCTYANSLNSAKTLSAAATCVFAPSVHVSDNQTIKSFLPL